jgi:uncharacterized protein (TIGR02145 family)
MKNLMIYLAAATMLFACKKEQIDYQYEEVIAKKGGGPGGGTSLVSTDAASYILPFGATSGGSIASGGGGTNVTDRGVCYSLTPNPTIVDATVSSGSGSGAFTCILSGLNGNTTYYTRAYATTVKQVKNKPPQTTTVYGNEESFTTANPNFGTMTDNDGNSYTTIQIGTQVWMMENLKTTTYRDGTPIPNVTDDAVWANLNTGAYCNLGNDLNNVNTYGRLYNQYAVHDVRNIAPAGWHVASVSEWQTLATYVGKGPGGSIAGAKLKEAGFVHWNPFPYVAGQEGNNSSGFTALGGGGRTVYNGSSLFGGKKEIGNWWCSGNSNYVYLQSSTDAIMGSGFAASGSANYDQRCGYSVRLIKD